MRTSCTGTAVYMAPEAHQQQDVCAKADIWSLGCTVIEMANGYGPVWAEYSRYKMFLYISGKQFDPQIPIELDEDGIDFVTQCLQQTPQLRPDATTLLKEPFILLKKPPEHVNQALLATRCYSSSSLFEGASGMPLITRHVSDESIAQMDIARNSEIDASAIAKYIVRGKEEAEDAAETDDAEESEVEISINKENQNPFTASNRTRPVISRKRSMRSSIGLDTTSRRLSTGSMNSDTGRMLNSIDDVREVMRLKALDAKKKHIQWLVEEQVNTEQGKVDGFGEWLQNEEEQWKCTPKTKNEEKQWNRPSKTTKEQNLQIAGPNTVCITKGLSKNDEMKEFEEKMEDEFEGGDSAEYDYNSE